MKIRVWLPGLVALGMVQYSHAQTLYYRSGDKKIELLPVTDFVAARVLWNAVESKAKRKFDSFFATVPSVGLRQEELLLQKADVPLQAALSSIKRYLDMEEMQKLSVFRTRSGGRFLVEFPELIVQFKTGVSPARAEAHIRLYSNLYRQAQVPGLYYVRLGNVKSTLLIAEQFWGSTLVDYCEPRFRVVAPSAAIGSTLSPNTLPPPGPKFPNDVLFSRQWALAAGTGTPRADIRIQGAWDRSRGDKAVLVAVLDDGIDTSHPDLENATDAVWDVITQKSEMKLEASALHGTAAAGIIAARTNNSLGIAGTAPEAHLIAIRIASRDSLARWTSDAGWIAEGIDKAMELGAKVLNNSWGVEESQNVRRAIQRALNPPSGRKPAILVFSAGNEGDGVQFPASMANDFPVIAVGASTLCNSLKTRLSCDGDSTWASNLGDSLTLLAPGTGIPTLRRSVDKNGANPNNYLLNFSGTSASAPFVSAVAALMLSQDKTGTLTPAKVRDMLRTTGDAIVSNGITFRRLNACRALGGTVCD